MTLNVTSRVAWQPRLDPGPWLRQVPYEVWIHHSVTRATADPYEDMRHIEDVGEQRGLGGMPYSWCYHPPSRLWIEGAGGHLGAHTKGHNSRALGLAVIGNTETDPIPHFAEDAADLIRWLIDTGRLAEGRDYPTGGHRELKPTVCPGAHAYAAIPTIRQLLQEDDDMPFTDQDRQLLRDVHEQLTVNRPEGHPDGATIRGIGAKLLERTRDLVTGARPRR